MFSHLTFAFPSLGKTAKCDFKITEYGTFKPLTMMKDIIKATAAI